MLRKKIGHPDHYEYIRQLVIPKSLRAEVMSSLHDDQAGGAHFGIDKTYAKIKERYYWEGMLSDIQRWIQSCYPCQMRKSPRIVSRAPLKPIEVSGPFSHIVIDVMSEIPESEKKINI